MWQRAMESNSDKSLPVKSTHDRTTRRHPWIPNLNKLRLTRSSLFFALTKLLANFVIPKICYKHTRFESIISKGHTIILVSSIYYLTLPTNPFANRNINMNRSLQQTRQQSNINTKKITKTEIMTNTPWSHRYER